MNEPSPAPSDELYRCIVTAMAGAGTLTAALLDYIDSALFPPAPDRLATFLRDDDSSERDSLLDLIFYPDVAFQVRIEPLLANVTCAADHERALRRRLLSTPIDAPVSMPDGTPLAVVPLPEFIKAQYLDRLRLAWPMDAAIGTAISVGVGGDLAPVVRVRLRNSGLRANDTQRQFLCRFFERMPDDASDYLACLDLVLSLIGVIHVGDDVYALLVDHKRGLFRSLQQARRFETMRKSANMETLMLQGVRTPHASCDRLMDDMRLVDRICMGIFGRTEPIAMPMEEPLRQVSDLDDPAAAVHSLWR